MKAISWIVVLVLAAASGACSGSDSSSGLTTASAPTVTDTDTGTVPPPVGGVFQSDIKTFTTTQAGTVSVVLTSAIETLTGGTLLPTVVMGITIGTSAGGVCTPLSGASTTASAGSSTVLSGTLAAGAYCVAISDVTNQVGPVAYTLLISHPQ